MAKLTLPLDADHAPGLVVSVGTVLLPGSNYRFQTFPALLDTGASCTCVNEELLKALGLEPKRWHDNLVTPSTGAKGEKCPIYEVSLAIQMVNKRQSPEKTGAFFVEKMEVAGMRLDFANYRILIGRNILVQGMLDYDGPNGKFSLTFDDSLIVP